MLSTQRMEALIDEPFYSALFVGLGVILFLLEIFIPSGGILGLFAIGSTVLGVFGFFHQGRSTLGFGSILAAVVFGFVILRYGLRRLQLHGTLSRETSHSVDESIPGLEGKEGETITPLRPAGMALIDGKRVDVVAPGKFIEKGHRVRVVETSGNRVVVREIT
ncbi:MAG: hypothetical protein JXA90_06365 [Planctomycetes bacterium]|nr:hypothetical protein [Planctomycetota bacterium]